MTVARHRALDRLRRDRTERRKLAHVEVSAPRPDDRLQAMFTACHAEAPSLDHTHWAQILVLYDLLLAAALSPIVRLNRAVAVARVHGAAAGLAEADAVADELAGYHLLHAVRGMLLHELGELEQERAEQLRAARLTANPAEQALLRRRIGALGR